MEIGIMYHNFVYNIRLIEKLIQYEYLFSNKKIKVNLYQFFLKRSGAKSRYVKKKNIKKPTPQCITVYSSLFLKFFENL